jgi:hypothetical protein
LGYIKGGIKMKIVYAENLPTLPIIGDIIRIGPDVGEVIEVGYQAMARTGSKLR